ncbi:MAG TPA: glucose-6-phosphate isomerase [Burkholderiaceae bacterium]|nr:glucose-6-phosphate isomerase [Burkholderiaceae bacterium]
MQTASDPLPNALVHARATVEALARAQCDASIEALFETEPDRLDRFVVDAAGLSVDLSRNNLPSPALDALIALAEAAEVPRWRDAMYAGAPINTTEGRAALHAALRDDPEAPLCGVDGQLLVDGDDVHRQVRETLARMGSFADAVRDGRWLGDDGRPITDIVNVGIGGSHLGPQLCCEALAEFAHPRLRCHFLSNVDPQGWRELSRRLDPGTTLAIVASKSWRTQETALNAAAVRDWLRAGGVPERQMHRHLAGVTARPDAARADGLADDAIFPFGDWVGGRYSLWSAVGLSAMLQIGPQAFGELLAGAHLMDRHFAEAPPARNAPLLLALVSLWNGLLHDGATEVTVPYSTALARLPAWLQQLQMESNGKRVDRDGQPLPWHTAPACWGSAGTDAQHSYFQALHQGTRVHPVDFVVPLPAAGGPAEAGRANALLAHALAQAEALMRGRPPTIRRPRIGPAPATGHRRRSCSMR